MKNNIKELHQVVSGDRINGIPFNECDAIIGPGGIEYNGKAIAHELSTCEVALMDDCPSLFYFFNRLNIFFTFYVPTMGTDDYNICINPNFWEKLKQISYDNFNSKLILPSFVLLHEIYHHVYNHIESGRLLRAEYPVGGIQNRAMDYEINYAIEDTWGDDFKGCTKLAEGCYNEKYGNYIWESIYEHIKNEPILPKFPELPNAPKTPKPNQPNQPNQPKTTPTDDWKNGFAAGAMYAKRLADDIIKIKGNSPDVIKEVMDVIKKESTKKIQSGNLITNESLLFESYSTYNEGFADGIDAIYKQLVDSISQENSSGGQKQQSIDINVPQVQGLPKNKKQDNKSNNGENGENGENGNDGSDSGEDGNNENQNSQGKEKPSVGKKIKDQSDGFSGDGNMLDNVDILYPHTMEEIVKRSGEGKTKPKSLQDDEDTIKNVADSVLDDLKKRKGLSEDKVKKHKKILEDGYNNIKIAKIGAIDWKLALQDFVSNKINVSEIRGYKKNKLHMGYYIKATKTKEDKKMRHIVIGFDTSGSIFSKPNAQEYFLAEVISLIEARASQNTIVDIIKFNNGVYDIFRVLITNPENIDGKFDDFNTSSGGTEYTELLHIIDVLFMYNIDEVENLSENYNGTLSTEYEGYSVDAPTCAIIFTDSDLYGSKIPNMSDSLFEDNILWVLLGVDATGDDAPYGRTIKVTHKQMEGDSKENLTFTNEGFKDILSDYDAFDEKKNFKPKMKKTRK